MATANLPTSDPSTTTFPKSREEPFFESGSKAGIRPDHAGRLARQLRQLNDAREPKEMNIPGWRLHALGGDLVGHWSVTVNGNWRMTFVFEDQDAILVDYQDYH